VKIDDEKIILEVLQAGENDAMCCPTMLATRTWSLQGGQLKEDEIEVTGQLSLSVLEGTEWVLARMSREETVMDGAEVTLAFIDGRITGKSACNRYSADIEEGDNAGDIKIGQSMSTMMACPDELMKVEREYLDVLSQVTSFSFHAGSLALNGQKKDGTPFSMLFSRAEKDIPEGTSN
jgi:heat shock protein HslJ